MPTLWIVVSVIGLAMLAGLVSMVLIVQRLRLQLSHLKLRLESIGSDFNALCSGAAGVDRRVTVLENQSRRLDHRQESLENRKQDDRPYGEAIQMVHNGATAAGLVDKLGLSRSEADLVVMLHGVRKAS